MKSWMAFAIVLLAGILTMCEGTSKIKLGLWNANVCPDGSEAIKTEEECGTAAGTLKHSSETYLGVTNADVEYAGPKTSVFKWFYPTGCYLASHSNKVYWNDYKPGKGKRTARPICEGS